MAAADHPGDRAQGHGDSERRAWRAQVHSLVASLLGRQVVTLPCHVFLVATSVSGMSNCQRPLMTLHPAPVCANGSCHVLTVQWLCRIRDLNDEINKLIREKGHWETRIVELGGPDYAKSAPKITDSEGQEMQNLAGVHAFACLRRRALLFTKAHCSHGLVQPPQAAKNSCKWTCFLLIPALTPELSSVLIFCNVASSPAGHTRLQHFHFLRHRRQEWRLPVLWRSKELAGGAGAI